MILPYKNGYLSTVCCYIAFKKIGLPSTLTDFGIDDAHFAIMAEKAVRIGGLQNAYVPLSEDDVIKILYMSL